MGDVPFGVPITELSNEITKNIDISDPETIVQKLQQCDSELFSGWRNHPSLNSPETSKKVEELSELFLGILNDSNSRSSSVIFSGCGTSGRLGFALARKFNCLAKLQGTDFPNLYHYLIAGGDVALFTSREIPEDDWKQGQIDLQRQTAGKGRVLYVGITCGLSAPYVAGQLEYCMDNSDVFIPVLLGFNPVSLARKRTIEGWSKTFFDVANRLWNHHSGLILNPIVGPEAITGSSRMKGASATKILLETSLFLAHYHYQQADLACNPSKLISCYNQVYQDTYKLNKEISRAVALSGISLLSKGHLFYITWGSLGFMSLLDASECVPTFSASFNDVRAFVDGGFKMLQNREGELYETVDGTPLEISIADFEHSFLSSLTSLDIVVLICLKSKHFHHLKDMVERVARQQSKIIAITTSYLKPLSQDCDVSIKLDIAQWLPMLTGLIPNKNIALEKSLMKSFCEMSLKWILNAISTGAHVIKGKVLQNFMIDVKVSNNKLFHRAVSIVAQFSNASEKESFMALLKSIYKTDNIPETLVSKVTSEHVKVGMQEELVVPLAILLATGKFDVTSGLAALKTNSVAKLLQGVRIPRN